MFYIWHQQLDGFWKELTNEGAFWTEREAIHRAERLRDELGYMGLLQVRDEQNFEIRLIGEDWNK